MPILNKPYASWTEEDLQSLIEIQQTENIHLEYKETFGDLDHVPGKRELCKDVSAFANSQGGAIIIGMRDSDERDRGSIPTELVPIEDASLKERAEDILLGGILPRPDIRFHPIPSQQGDGEYVIIEVPKSLIGVHMVTLPRTNRYYMRRDYKALPMSPYEIENAFRSYLQVASNIKERLLEFHRTNPNQGIMVNPPAWISVTVIPRFPTEGLFVRFCQLNRLEIEGIGQSSNAVRTRSGLEGRDEFKLTYEGLQVRESILLEGGPTVTLYSHMIYRNGAVYLGLLLTPIDQLLTEQRDLRLRVVIACLHDMISFASGFFSKADYFGPVDIMIKLDNVGQSVPLGIDHLAYRHAEMTTNHFEEVLTTTIRDIESRLPGVLRNVLDHLWQSFGESFCHFYTEDGENYRPNVFTIRDNQLHNF